MNYEAVYRTAPATPGLLNKVKAIKGVGKKKLFSIPFSKSNDLS